MGKFQGTEHFLIHCERHFSSRLPLSGGTWKYAKAPSTKKPWRVSLPIDMLLSAVSALVVAQSSSEIPEGLMNNPLHIKYAQVFLQLTAQLILLLLHVLAGNHSHLQGGTKVKTCMCAVQVVT